MIDAVSMAPNLDIHPTNPLMVECIGLPHSRDNRFKENYHLLYHTKKGPCFHDPFLKIIGED